MRKSENNNMVKSSSNLVSVLIAMRNHADMTIEVINDLELQTFQDFNIIIFDDVSEKSEINKIRNLKNDKIIIYSNPGPWKFEGDLKWNTHLKLAIKQNSKYIYNIHNDMKIHDTDLLEIFVDFMENNNDYGAIGPTIYNAKGNIGWGPEIKRTRMGRTLALNETYFVRTKCFQEMGLMPEKFIYYGSEDYTFFWLHDHGYKMKAIEGVSVTHYGGGTSTAFQNQKDYYRPRTTILIIKLFCKKELFLTKLRYFYRGLSEPRIKLKKFLINFQIFNLFRTLFLLFLGTVIGLVTPIEMNKPYKIDD